MKTAREYQQEILPRLIEINLFDSEGARLGYVMGEFMQYHSREASKCLGPRSLGDLMVMILGFAESKATFISFEEAYAYAFESQEMFEMDMIAFIYRDLSRLYLQSTKVSPEGEDSYRSLVQRLFNHVCALAVILVVDDPIKGTFLRSWRTYSKQGKLKL